MFKISHFFQGKNEKKKGGTGKERKKMIIFMYLA